MANLTRRAQVELEWLDMNPYSWGGHLKRGEPPTDPYLVAWIDAGWIKEARLGTQHGYVLTAKGRAALDGARTHG